MIAEARAALLAVLETAGIPAFENVPDRAQPPMAVMVPAADWIENGEVFGEFTISFDVEIVAGSGTNQAISLALDGMVEDVLTAIAEAPSMYAAAVGQPATVDLGNGPVYLGATITVKQHLQL
jgi:hypothetical protein